MSAEAPDRSRSPYLVSLFEGRRLHAPGFPPAAVAKAMLGGTQYLAGLLGIVYLATTFLNEPGFTSVALFLFVMLTWVALSRAALCVWFWRYGVLTRAQITKDEPIEKEERGSLIVERGYVHEARVTFREQDGRAWDAVFSTTEPRMNSQPLPTHVELVYADTPLGLLRAAVFLDYGELCFCKLLQPGQPLGIHWLWLGVKAVAVLGFLAAAYVTMPAVRFRIHWLLSLVLGWAGWI